MRVSSTTFAMPRVTRESVRALAQSRTAPPPVASTPSSSSSPEPGQSSGGEQPKTVWGIMMKIFQSLVKQLIDEMNEEVGKLEKRLKEHLAKVKELQRQAR